LGVAVGLVPAVNLNQVPGLALPAVFTLSHPAGGKVVPSKLSTNTCAIHKFETSKK
jgi:hypothetical protein